jgi:signal transduction histidine kinase
VLTEDARAMLFHIAREALTNARKHASASSIRFALRYDDHALSLEIRDDGKGFEPAAAHREEQRGLRNMRTRAVAIGAQLNVTSASDAGTAITVTLPIANEEGS